MMDIAQCWTSNIEPLDAAGMRVMLNAPLLILLDKAITQKGPSRGLIDKQTLARYALEPSD